jgi:hypothetical protein
MTERRLIPGYRHYVTMDGVVTRHDGRIVSQSIDWKGYVKVNVHKESGKFVSLSLQRAVALAWIPNPNGLPQVNHIDGDKKNNHPSNLHWVSNRENIDHAFATGLHPNPPIAVVGVNTLTGETIWARSQQALGKLGINFKLVNYALKRCTSRRTGGFVWAYENEIDWNDPDTSLANIASNFRYVL